MKHTLTLSKNCGKVISSPRVITRFVTAGPTTRIRRMWSLFKTVLCTMASHCWHKYNDVLFVLGVFSELAPESMISLFTAIEDDGLHWSQTRTAMLGLFLEAFKVKQCPQNTGLFISTGGLISIVILSGSIIDFFFEIIVKRLLLKGYAMFIALHYFSSQPPTRYEGRFTAANYCIVFILESWR